MTLLGRLSISQSGLSSKRRVMRAKHQFPRIARVNGSTAVIVGQTIVNVIRKLYYLPCQYLIGSHLNYKCNNNNMRVVKVKLKQLGGQSTGESANCLDNLLVHH
ncbi:unnamed protein product [Ceratitis capitata]|uniref:(Mediterranean fruit fly) hypothetical protein n=1 Tax=Ceratitis capitata TaxID=7213 RepID=A0A811U666_CERCA|nr:unnamed protein product [Ceratitis capitata]